jgi:GNAT superfamily N-acetyltransferase
MFHALLRACGSLSSLDVRASRGIARRTFGPAFAVFRRSLMVYVHRLGVVDSPDVTDAMLDEQWVQRRPWIEHLWRTAAENWIAVDEAGQPIGWAMSNERDGHLGLTFFFVSPGTQSQGVGRALLDRAFPLGRGRHRAILATQDPRALSRYLRQGVRFVTSALDFEAAPRAVELETDLVFERLPPNEESVRLIGDIEAELIGHRRNIDIAFMLEQRPAWLARRAGRGVAFAFGASDELTGPMGAFDPGDIPALLALVETEAAAAGLPNIYFSTPLANDAAVSTSSAAATASTPSSWRCSRTTSPSAWTAGSSAASATSSRRSPSRRRIERAGPEGPAPF